MTKDFYSINELSTITGFTTRSLRNFIQMDFLKGKKIEGEWQFSPEQIEFKFFSQKDKTRIIIAGEKDFVKQILLLI